MRSASPADVSPIPEAEAPRDCPLCPRLVAFRHELRVEYPDWWNAPVPAFGDRGAWLAIVGLAPGKHGANRTGRPFTGDYAGDLLFATLLKFGLADGEYRADPGDGLRLNGAIILNAVKCLPPENKPEPREIAHLPKLFRSRARFAADRPGADCLGQIAPCRRRPRARPAARGNQVRPSSPSTRRPTAGSCCRATIARATTRTPAGLTRRCSKACSSWH